MGIRRLAASSHPKEGGRWSASSPFTAGNQHFFSLFKKGLFRRTLPFGGTRGEARRGPHKGAFEALRRRFPDPLPRQASFVRRKASRLPRMPASPGLSNFPKRRKTQHGSTAPARATVTNLVWFEEPGLASVSPPLVLKQALAFLRGHHDLALPHETRPTRPHPCFARLRLRIAGARLALRLATGGRPSYWPSVCIRAEHPSTTAES